MTNPQSFGFQFHLWSLSYAFSRQLAFALVTLLFAARQCWHKQVKAAVHGCILAFSLDSMMPLSRYITIAYRARGFFLDRHKGLLSALRDKRNNGLETNKYNSGTYNLSLSSFVVLLCVVSTSAFD